MEAPSPVLPAPDLNAALRELADAANAYDVALARLAEAERAAEAAITAVTSGDLPERPFLTRDAEGHAYAVVRGYPGRVSRYEGPPRAAVDVYPLREAL